MKFQNHKTSITILGILIIGSLFAVGYATSTVISDSGIITSNLTVTGTCTGCGGGEGDFTTYSNFLNATIGGASLGNNIKALLTANDGSFMFSDNAFQNIIVFANGTVIKEYDSTFEDFPNGDKLFDQSSTGKYKIIYDQGHSNEIKVYKDNSLLQSIGIDTSQVSANECSTAISANGKYISLVCSNFAGTNDTALTFEGS